MILPLHFLSLSLFYVGGRFKLLSLLISFCSESLLFLMVYKSCKKAHWALSRDLHPEYTHWASATAQILLRVLEHWRMRPIRIWWVNTTCQAGTVGGFEKERGVRQGPRFWGLHSLVLGDNYPETIAAKCTLCYKRERKMAWVRHCPRRVKVALEERNIISNIFLN